MDHWTHAATCSVCAAIQEENGVLRAEVRRLRDPRPTSPTFNTSAHVRQCRAIVNCDELPPTQVMSLTWPSVTMHTPLRPMAASTEDPGVGGSETQSPGECGDDDGSETQGPGECGDDDGSETQGPGECGDDDGSETQGPGECGDDDGSETQGPGECGDDGSEAAGPRDGVRRHALGGIFEGKTAAEIRADYNRLPERSSGPACVHVCRRKEDRLELQAHCCPDCEAWFADLSPESRRKRLQVAGRHRSNQPKIRTGDAQFWAIEMPPTPPEAPIEAMKSLPRRKRPLRDLSAAEAKKKT